MKNEKLDDSLKNFRSAFDKLKEATQIAKDRPLVSRVTSIPHPGSIVFPTFFRS